ncbi:MAG: anti-sigma factor family protein [Candidatus Acidiferrales bacterium]
MNHKEATRIKAAERYVLGELSGELREQYEEHFFTCAECADELRYTAAFAASARDVFSAEAAGAPLASAREPRTTGRFAFLLRPSMAIAAIVLLAFVVGYQNFRVIPRLKTAVSQSAAPVALSSFSLIGVNSRGGAPLAISLPPGRPFSLYLDIPPQNQFPIYTCELEDAAGASDFSLEITAQQAKDTVQLLIPAGRITMGKHVVVVRGSGNVLPSGATGVEVARYPFTLEYTK